MKPGALAREMKAAEEEVAGWSDGLRKPFEELAERHLHKTGFRGGGRDEEWRGCLHLDCLPACQHHEPYRCERYEQFKSSRK